MELYNARTWVVKHAKEIIERMSKYPPDQPIVMKMGYGPSGIPHLGTITELIRTCMVGKALRQMQQRPVLVISFCDNLDGMRKVPPNIPNHEMLLPFMGYPLCRIPDPYMSEDSFAEHNIQKLAQMANEFGYSVYDYRPTKDKQFSLEELIARNSDDIILLRASDMYGSGSYNELLAELLKNYHKILDVLLPTLGEERAQTYSPFMPISPITGKVLEIGVTNYHPEDNSITFMENNQKHTLKVEYDNFKLQWKVDFALQWLCFKISYEMSGKDITEGTVPVAKGVLEALEREPPITPVYEMFLAADGSRMSKTKGNGISLDDLVKYTSPEVIRHFMFLNPTSAKRLDMQKMPAYIDAFIKDLELFNSGQIVEENPIWYSENVAPADPHFNASTILNVIQGIHPPDANSVISFVNKRFSLNELDVKIINSMYHFYHDHHIKPHYVDLPEHLVKYMVEFLDFLSDNPLEMQTKLYELGNQAVAAHDVPDLKSWFEAIYKSLIGTKQGPRLGSFFALYGVEESVKLIRNACKIMA